ncbi:hypothetical protein ACGFZA_07745 [Streptomyces sp. NPDC048211]
MPSEHYKECPQYADSAAPRCYCEGITQADENYWTEPDEPAASA